MSNNFKINARGKISKLLPISTQDLSKEYNLYKMISESETLILTSIPLTPSAKYVAHLSNMFLS